MCIRDSTTLDREMMPLLRYRTRDLTRILPGKCPCGRTHLRIDRIKGRSDDMFIIKGVNIFPMQVEKILVQFPQLGSNYLITLETVNNQDEMIVEVELSDLSTDNYIELERIRKEITRQLKDEILVTPKLKLVKKGSLPQSCLLYTSLPRITLMLRKLPILLTPPARYNA